jgi:hypothetical protein
VGSSAVDLRFGIAVVSAGNRVYAVAMATGKTVLLAKAEGHVAAQIDTPGVAYQYNAGGHGYVRFVPLSRILSALA